MKPVILYILFSIYILSGLSFLNDKSPKNKLYLKQLEIADAYKEIKAYAKAVEYYSSAYKSSKAYTVAESLAECYFALRDYENALLWYERMEHSSFIDTEILLQYVSVLKMNGKYSKAKEILQIVTSLEPSLERECIQQSAWCDSAASWLSHPALYKVTNLERINTEYSELNPVLSGSGLVFSSNRTNAEYTKTDMRTMCSYYNIFESAIEGENEFSKPRLYSDKINSKWHDISCTFTGDFDTIYYASSKKTSDGEKFRIYRCSKKGSEWGDSHEFILNDSLYSFAHPAISANGQMFVFSANIPGGMGGVDLYVSFRIDTTWTAPVNMGSKINSEYDEINPFFHEDGTLYFSSDRFTGLGGYDIYYSKLDEQGWEKPNNMKAPVNSSADDLYICPNYNKKLLYISSNRRHGKGREDIYLVKIQ